MHWKRSLMAALGLAAAMCTVAPPTAQAARLKDIAFFTGTRTNPLIGYGLVAGLNGTGDNTKTQFTVNTLANLLDNMGVHVDPTQVQVKNVAAVMVTAKLPPFARAGSRADVEIASIGDAKSLEGGNLLMTTLQGPDGQIYAVAQGPVTVGGFSASGASGSSVQKNVTTSALIGGGAVIERELPMQYAGVQQLDLILRNPDFTTATKAASKINESVQGASAQAVDAATIKLQIPATYQNRAVEMITRIENLEIQPDSIAKVVINERTGTIVMGENVRISPVAVAHGNLTVQISEQPAVSQPLPFSNGKTAVVPQTTIQVQEGKGSLSLVGGGITIGQVIQGLNAIGATPRDLISILQAIKAAGALQGDLDVI